MGVIGWKISPSRIAKQLGPQIPLRGSAWSASAAAESRNELDFVNRSRLTCAFYSPDIAEGLLACFSDRLLSWFRIIGQRVRDDKFFSISFNGSSFRLATNKSRVTFLLLFLFVVVIYVRLVYDWENEYKLIRDLFIFLK